MTYTDACVRHTFWRHAMTKVRILQSCQESRKTPLVLMTAPSQVHKHFHSSSVAMDVWSIGWAELS